MVRIKELSMGMSHDYRVAIQEGATIVRIGTALFGKRGNNWPTGEMDIEEKKLRNNKGVTCLLREMC